MPFGAGPEGIHFENAEGSVLADTAYLSGSIVKYVSFRNCHGISMRYASVVVEDCSFHRAAATGELAGSEPGAVVHFLDGEFHCGKSYVNAQVDSNHFTAEVGVRAVHLDPNQTDPYFGPFDFRNNYWSTTDMKDIKARFLNALGEPVPAMAKVEPILTAPPPDAGRRK